MAPRKLALGLAALMLVSALPALTNASEPAARTYLVVGAPASMAVLDDYGAFATAVLTEHDAEALRTQGAQVEELDTRLLRGAWALEGSDAALPAGMRSDGSPFHLVQFRGPVKPEWRAALEAGSERVYDALPHFAFLAKLAPGQADALRAMPEVAFVGPYHAALKLSPQLPWEGEALVTILTFPGEPLAPVTLRVVQAGGVVLAEDTSFPLDGIVKARVAAGALPGIARMAEVSWIEPAPEGAGLDNAQASAITQSGTTTLYPVHAKGVDGSSQRVSVCDTGVHVTGSKPVAKMTHEMFDDPAWPFVVWNTHVPPPAPQHRKVMLYYAPQPNGGFQDENGHGTHTAGTLAGDAPLYGTRNGNDGVAYAAKLLVCDITGDTGAFYIATNYAEYWDPAYNLGARVNSNSWGQTHNIAYLEVARQHDSYVWDHRDFVILRSMGNTGVNTIRPEAVAKSALGIGAGNNGAGMESLASFSSRGPTQDGRIKPNVIAPGACLTSSSAGSINGYVCLSGTSMSTPTVAGAAGLVRDYFVKGYYPSGVANTADTLNPSSALVRGILEVSGKRITGSLAGTGFPNGNQGWGRVLLDDALFFAGDSRKLLAQDEGTGLSTGGEQVFSVSVGAGQPLKVMLTWSDRPGAAGANPALVNDLDLVVVAPGGATYLGNVFSNGESVTGGTRDTRNVDEAVLLGAPLAGTYTVKVRGTNVPSGPQTFALVATHG